MIFRDTTESAIQFSLFLLIVCLILILYVLFLVDFEFVVCDVVVVISWNKGQSSVALSGITAEKLFISAICNCLAAVQSLTGSVHHRNLLFPWRIGDPV